MKKNILLILGVLFSLVPFVFNTYSIFRIIALGLGIILITISFLYSEKRNIIMIVVLPIILLLACYGLDTLIFSKLNRMPIFVYAIKSSDKVSVYNSFFYRIYNCNNSLVVDYGYSKAYACDETDLESINVNTILSEPYESYKKYDHKFIKVNGKISKISGIDTIELSFYDKTEDTLNGNVKFNSASLIRIKTDSSLTNYRIYDEINVIGLVSSLTTEGESTIINLTDTVLIPSEIYDDYSLEVITNDNKEIKDFVKDKNYYLYGIDNIYIKYSSDVIYELSYTITDTRISLDELLKDVPEEEIKNENDELVAKTYKTDKFKVFICEENNKTYFVNSKLKFNDELCQ